MLQFSVILVILVFEIFDLSIKCSDLLNIMGLAVASQRPVLVDFQLQVLELELLPVPSFLDDSQLLAEIVASLGFQAAFVPEPVHLVLEVLCLLD